MSSPEEQVQVTLDGRLVSMPRFLAEAAGQKVKLVLPDGLELLPNEQAEQEVTAQEDYTQVSWRVRSKNQGEFTLTATSTTGARAAHKVRIRDSSLFH